MHEPERPRDCDLHHKRISPNYPDPPSRHAVLTTPADRNRCLSASSLPARPSPNLSGVGIHNFTFLGATEISGLEASSPRLAALCRNHFSCSHKHKNKMTRLSSSLSAPAQQIQFRAEKSQIREQLIKITIISSLTFCAFMYIIKP
jgi:hypothetical protein